MSNFKNNKNVTLEDLKNSNNYSEEIINSLMNRNFKCLAELPADKRADVNFMEPILYAVRNKFKTYEVFKYYSNSLQNDVVLASEIVKEQAYLIEGTPLAKNEKFIIDNVEKAPEIIKYMSSELKENDILIQTLSNINNQEIRNEIAQNCDVSTLLQNNPELISDKQFMEFAIAKDVAIFQYAGDDIKNDYNFMQSVCYKNDEAISYVAEHTMEFGEKGLNAAKDVAIDKSSQSAIDGFEEQRAALKAKIEQDDNQDQNIQEMDEIIKRDKQLARHIKFINKIKSGEVDPVRAARLMDRICKNMDPEYKKKIGEIISMDDALEKIKEAQNKENSVAETEEKNIQTIDEEKEL